MNMLKKRMYQILVIAAAAAAITACSSGKTMEVRPAHHETENIETETIETEIPSETEAAGTSEEKAADVPAGKVIEPLPGTIDTSHISDGIFDVAFSEGRDVFAEADGQTVIRMELYEEVRYDAVDVASIAVGDTLKIDGEAVTVKALKEINGGIQINDDGVYTLSPSDGGTYVLVGSSDYVIRANAGEVTLPISEKCRILDSSDLNKKEQTLSREEFIKSASGSDRIYAPGNTTVRVEDGWIVELTHTYAP